MKCNKAHLTECPEFSTSKQCPRGSNCPLSHRLKKQSKTNKLTKILKLNTKKPATKKQEFGASFISFEESKLIENKTDQLPGFINNLLNSFLLIIARII